MKAATHVSARDASAVLHAPSGVLEVSRVHEHTNALKLTDSRRTCQEQIDPRRSSKATYTPYQKNERHYEGEFPSLDHVWHSGRVLPLASELLHHCNSASFALND